MTPLCRRGVWISMPLDIIDYLGRRNACFDGRLHIRFENAHSHRHHIGLKKRLGITILVAKIEFCASNVTDYVFVSLAKVDLFRLPETGRKCAKERVCLLYLLRSRHPGRRCKNMNEFPIPELKQVSRAVRSTLTELFGVPA